MKDLRNSIESIAKRGPVAVGISTIVSVLFITGLVQAATTISTNISTDGTLSVTGASTLTGAVSAVGKVTSGSASTTVLSVTNTAYFGGSATTTIGPAGNIVTPHANTATTSITVGCIQTYATSTATAIRLEFGVNNMASTTYRTGGAIASGAAQSSAGGGQMVWVYGTCP